MRILVAPDKFKSAATAAAVGAAIADGLRANGRQHGIAIDVDVLPIADGGDGTVAAALAAGFDAVGVRVRGPVGNPVEAQIAVRHAEGRSIALVELAATCGMALLPDGALRPLDAHTGGLGEAMRIALDQGADDLLIGVGGSASFDAGLGALVALGARILDAGGRPLEPGAASLGRIARIDLTGLHPRLASARIRIITDVDNPLLGPRGTVAVFGPQKGVTAEMAPQIEAGLARVAEVIAAQTGRSIAELPGGGASGGTAGALHGLLDAQMVPGAAFMLDLIGLRERLAGADLVVTGEGAFDAQTVHGKAPAAVLEAARDAGVPAVIIAGRIDMADDELAPLGVAQAIALVDLAADEAASMRDTLALLTRAGGLVNLTR